MPGGCATGAFEADNVPALMMSIVRGERRALPAEAPAELAQLVSEMLAPAPGDRPLLRDICRCAGAACVA